MPIITKVSQLGGLIKIQQAGSWRLVVPAGLDLSAGQLQTIAQQTTGLTPGFRIDPDLIVTGLAGEAKDILFLSRHQEPGPCQRILPPADPWLPVAASEQPQSLDFPLLGLVPEYDYAQTLDNIMAEKEVLIKDWRAIDSYLKKTSVRGQDRDQALLEVLLGIARSETYQAERVCQLLAYRIEDSRDPGDKRHWIDLASRFYDSLLQDKSAGQEIKDVSSEFQVGFLFHYGRYEQALSVLEGVWPQVHQGKIYNKDQLAINLIGLDLFKLQLNILLGRPAAAAELIQEIEGLLASQTGSHFRQLVSRGIFSLLKVRFLLDQDRPAEAQETLLEARWELLRTDRTRGCSQDDSLAAPETQELFDRLCQAYADHSRQLDDILDRISRSIGIQIMELQHQISDLNSEAGRKSPSPSGLAENLRLAQESSFRSDLYKLRSQESRLATLIEQVDQLGRLNDILNLVVKYSRQASSPDDYLETLLHFNNLLDQNCHSEAEAMHRLTEDLIGDYFTLILLLKIDACLIQKTSYCPSLGQALTESSAFIDRWLLAVKAKLLRANGQNCLSELPGFSYWHGENLARSGRLDQAELCWRSAWLLGQAPAAAQRIVESRLKTARTPGDLKNLVLLIKDPKNRSFKSSLPDWLADFSLAWADFQLGHNWDAAWSWQRLASEAQEPADQAHLSYLAGRAFLAGGDLASAASCLQKALEHHQADRSLSRTWQVLFSQVGEPALVSEAPINELLAKIEEIEARRSSKPTGPVETKTGPSQPPLPAASPSGQTPPPTPLRHQPPKTDPAPRLADLFKIENGRRGEAVGALKNWLSHKLPAVGGLLAGKQAITLGRIANPYHLLDKLGLVEIDLREFDAAQQQINGCLVNRKDKINFNLNAQGIALDLAEAKEDPILKPFYEALVVNLFLRLQSPAEPWLDEQLGLLAGKLSRRDDFAKLISYYPNTAEKDFLTAAGLGSAGPIKERLSGLRQQQLALILNQLRADRAFRGGEAAASYQIMEKWGLKKIVWQPADKAGPIRGQLVLADGRQIELSVDRQGDFVSALPDGHIQPVWNLFLENYALAVLASLLPVALPWEVPTSPSPFDYPLTILPRGNHSLTPYPTETERQIMSQLKFDAGVGAVFMESLMYLEIALEEKMAGLLSQRHLREGEIGCPYPLLTGLTGLNKLSCRHDRGRRTIQGELFFKDHDLLSYRIDSGGQLTIAKTDIDLADDPLIGVLLRTFILDAVLHLSSGLSFPLLHQNEDLVNSFTGQVAELFPLADRLANLAADPADRPDIVLAPTPEVIAIDRLAEGLGTIPAEDLPGPEEIGIKRTLLSSTEDPSDLGPGRTIAVDLKGQPNLPLARIIDKVLVSCFGDCQKKGIYTLVFEFTAGGQTHSLAAVLDRSGFLTLDNLGSKDLPFDLLDQLNQLALDLLNMMKLPEYRELLQGPRLSARFRQQKIKNLLKYLPHSPYVRQQIKKVFGQTQAGQKFGFVQTEGHDPFEAEFFEEVESQKKSGAPTSAKPAKILLKPIFDRSQVSDPERLRKFVVISPFTRFLPAGSHASQDAKLKYIVSEIVRAAANYGLDLAPDQVPAGLIDAYLAAVIHPDQPAPDLPDHPYFAAMIKHSQLEAEPFRPNVKRPADLFDQARFIRGSSPRTTSGLMIQDQTNGERSAELILPERTFVQEHLMLWSYEEPGSDD